MNAIKLVFALLLLSAQPLARAQLVDDGATRTLSGIVTNLDSLTIGNNASFTQLVLANGSKVTNNTSYVGYNAASANNSVIVDGEGSRWSQGKLYLGYRGTFNRLVITNGGFVNNTTWGYVGYAGGAGNNSVVVAGTNSVWQVFELLGSGKGENNSFLIANGGRVSSGAAILGIGDQAIVTDTGSSWTNSSFALHDGNTLVISNGGTMVSYGDSTVGSASGGTNIVSVSGTGSLWRPATLFVGSASPGNRLWVTNGGKLISGSATIGYSSSAAKTNAVTVSGAGSFWTNSSSLVVGNNSAANQLVVRSSAKAMSGSCTIGYTPWSGSGSSANEASVADPDTLLQVAGALDVGSGSSSAGNSLVVSNGAAVLCGSCTVGSGSLASSNEVLVTGPGSALQIGGLLRIGNSAADNRLVLSDGASVFADRLYLGTLLRSNSVTVNDGTLTITNDINLTCGALILNGGVVKVDTLALPGSSAAKLVLNGGTLQAHAISGASSPLRIGNGTSLATLDMLDDGTNYLWPGGLHISSNATLQGSGTMTGGVYVAHGATFSPGSPMGTVNIYGNMVLSNGSTTLVDINAGSGASDRVTVSGNLTYGGTLQVANTAGSFTNRAAFALFNAGSYSGAFTNIVPNTPGPGLRWNTNGLSGDGALRVAAVPTDSPRLSEVACAGGHLTFTVEGGNGFEPCHLLTSTNLSLPLAGWSPLRTNWFDGSGRLSFTNLLSEGEPQRYFTVRVE